MNQAASNFFESDAEIFRSRDAGLSSLCQRLGMNQRRREFFGSERGKVLSREKQNAIDPRRSESRQRMLLKQCLYDVPWPVACGQNGLGMLLWGEAPYLCVALGYARYNYKHAFGLWKNNQGWATPTDQKETTISLPRASSSKLNSTIIVDVRSRIRLKPGRIYRLTT